MKTAINGLMFVAAALLAVSPFAIAHQGNISNYEWAGHVPKSHAKDKVPYPLLHAATHNDIAKVKRLLANGVDIETKNHGNHTALYIAAAANSIEALRLLLEKGTDINTKNKDGLTALHIAAVNNRIEAVRLLLANGVNILAITNTGSTSLSYAKLLNRHVIVRILQNYTSGQFADLVVKKESAKQKIERKYADAWCEKHGGESQAKLTDNTIADCLTAKYAVEFDFALPQKSYECAGQALHYADVAKRKPLCILIEKAETTIKEFISAVAKIPPQVEVQCMNATGEIFTCPK